jgi:indole-3-glycerol phosphate synthase
MAAILERIVAATRARVAESRRKGDLRELEGQAERHVPRGFRRALQTKSREGVAVIAELKKASPSKGLIRSDFRPVELAKSLEAAGAAALSVLTDEEFFQGSLGYLSAASAAVSIPCLRKDFIIDPFQILEARAAGADAILLIVAAHTDEGLRRLFESAKSFGLDVLCEAHDAEEIRRATDLGFELIGVNSRDLTSFTVRTESLAELAELLPANAVRVAESGIRTAEDIAMLRKAGYHAFLVGETIMRQPDAGAALALLLDREYSREI